MPDKHSAEDYRRRAADMKAQAQRAETVYLQALYASIADNWDRLAAQMQAADRAHRPKNAEAEDDPPHGSPLPGSPLPGSKTKH